MKQYTTTEAAAELGVDPSRIRRMVLAGRLKGKKLGTQWVFTDRQLDAVRERKAGRPKGSKNLLRSE